MSIRPGRFLSIAIVVSWALLLGMHISRSYARRDGGDLIDLTPSTSAADAELTQRGVFYRGAKIGFIRERLTPLENGYRAEQTGDLTLTVLGRERRMKMEGSAETGSSGELREFSFRLSTSSRQSPFETTVLGKIEGDELELTIRSPRSERTERRPLEAPIVLPLNLYYSLAARGWTTGESYRVRLFDPMTLSEGEATIDVKEREVVRWGGREEEAHRLETTFAGLTTTAWVNESGEVLQEETPLGWTLRKEAPGSSLHARTAGPSPDVLLQSAVPAIGFAGDASKLTSAKLKLSNFPDGFDALDGGRQRFADDVVEVTVETAPYRGVERLDDDERAAALAADAFIQADDARIVEHAEKLTERLDSVEKAKVLSDWVYVTLAKSPTLSLPSATEILEQRVGDCNEHAVLYTALARAAGLPTRISTGLAYTGGQFYYHAWPEVWLGRWVAVDPTFGQFPADPLHVRLLTGGLETQYEVLGLLGRGASIEVLEIR
jgi:hypothetical protein